MPVAAWVVLQRLIPTGERSGLLTRIAAMGERFVVWTDEILTTFIELESAVQACGNCA